MSRRKKIEWDLTKRIALQKYLRQGYTLSNICEMWAEAGDEYRMSPVTLSREVKLGLSAKESAEKRFIKYDICRVYENLIGVDAVEYIQKNRITNDE